MTVKEYLQEAYRLSSIIEHKKNELKELREMVITLPSLIVGDDSSKGGEVKKGAKFERLIEKVEVLQDEIDVKMQEYIEKKHKIINEIYDISNPCFVNLLYKRYVQFKKFELIAHEMNYSYRQVKRLHKTALCEFEKRKP